MVISTHPIDSSVDVALFEAPQVSEAIAQFHVVRNSLLRASIKYYPILVGVVVFLDIVLFQHAALAGYVFLTGYIATAITLIAFMRLYDKVPETLQTLWARGVLRSSLNQPVAAQDYASFVRDFETTLNDRWGWYLGMITFLGNLPLLLFAAAHFAIGAAPEIAAGVILGCAIAFLAGVTLWRLWVVAYTLSRITTRFRVSVQPAHPDESGGLQPLGDLCFTNAFVVIVPALYFAMWIAVFSSPALLKAYPQLHVFQPFFEFGLFQIGLVLDLLAGLAVFLLPLYEVHREMVRQRLHHQQRLDNLTRQLYEVSQQLLNPTEALDTTIAQKRLDMLKSIRQVYQETRQFPVWPFNREIALKLTTAQVVPLLSLTGLSKPIIDIVGNFLNLLQPS